MSRRIVRAYTIANVSKYDAFLARDGSVLVADNWFVRGATLTLDVVPLDPVSHRPLRPEEIEDKAKL